MKKVLIAIDYNPTAQEIAESGYALAKSMNGEVILLHVIADYTYYSSLEYSPIMGFDSFTNLGAIQPDNMENLHNAGKEYLEKTKEYLRDNTITTVVKEGDTGDAILNAAKELHADVIVVGTHSRRGLEKILMGSVAEKVLRNTDVPMYIIPTKTEESK